MPKANIMSETYLHAFLDGQLSAQQSDEVQSYLSEHHDLSSEIQAYTTINNAVRNLYNPVIDEPIPDHLSQILYSPQPALNDLDELLEADRDYFRQWEDQEPEAVKAVAKPKPSTNQPRPAKRKKPKSAPVTPRAKPHPQANKAAQNIPEASGKKTEFTDSPKPGDRNVKKPFKVVGGSVAPPPAQAEIPAQGNSENASLSRLETAVNKLDQASSKITRSMQHNKPAQSEATAMQGAENSPHAPDPGEVSGNTQKHTEQQEQGFNLPSELDKLLEKDINLLEQKAKILGQEPPQYKEFGDTSKFKVPDFLHVAKTTSLNTPTIATIWILMCVTLGWLLYNALTESGPTETELLTRYAVDAHRVYSREATYAVEMDASDKSELSNWLSSRLDGDINPADLNSVGYKLMGGRLLPALGKHTAFFMYKNNNNERISIFISNIGKDEKQAWFNCEFTNKTSVCSWLSDKLSFRVIGDQPLVELRLIAKVIYQQLPHV